MAKQPLSLIGRGLVWCGALLLLLLAAPVAAQRPHPLTGADGPLPVSLGNSSAKLDVQVTALLERIYGLDPDKSTYSAVWWVVFTWRDDNAGAAVAKSTARALLPDSNCSRPCDASGMASAGCCDGIWLPHIELLNIVTYDDDQLPRYRINANATSGLVTWSTRLVGSWYSPFDFRAYPFEHQHLLMEFAMADFQSPVAGLVWQHVAKLNNTAHTKGADLSGWWMKWGKGKVFDTRACNKEYNITAPRYVAAEGALVDPANPPPAVYQSVAVTDRYLPANPGKGTTVPPDCGTYAQFYDEGRALYGPIVMIADVMIKRVSSYYVLTNLIPCLLITLVAFVVFFMPQDALGDRMSVVLTMFLSLTAMQFVFVFPPANYINALQMVVLVSYIMISIACVESLVVNRIATVSRAISNKRTCMRKYGQMLAKGGFDRYLTREANAKVGPGGGKPPAVKAPGRGAAKPPPVKRVPSGRADGAGNEVECARLDSAIEAQGQGQHVIFVAPNAAPRAASRPSRGAPRPIAGAGATSRRLPGGAAAPPAGPGSANGSASEREDTFPEIAEPHTAGNAAAPGAAFASPFASARTNMSFAAHSDGGDGRSEAGSTTMTSTTGITNTFAAGSGRRWYNCGGGRCCARGVIPTLRAFFVGIGAWLVGAARAPRQFYQQCKEDRAFAEFIAARIDKWSCITCFVAYTVVITVLLWFMVQVGDHHMMLGDRPGNM